MSRSADERARRWARVWAPAFLALLAGCEVGPDYHRPAAPEPPAYRSQVTTRPAEPLSRQWWTLYDDPDLTRLIRQADVYNQDIRQAVGRVQEARASARITASYLFPTVNLNPAFSRSRESGNRISPITGSRAPSFVYNDWLLPIDLTYEVDLWGRIRRSLETSVAQAQAASADAAFVRLTVESDVATYYFAVRSLDAQQKILDKTVGQYSEQVRLVSVQLKNGLVTQIDLFQARTLLENAQAQRRDTQRAREDEEHALAVLCGQPPAGFVIAARPLDEVVAPIPPTGLPAQLLLRRPDVAEAERNVAAANAQIGVATADFYPTFTLTGQAGFESADFVHLLNWQSKLASIGPSLSLPLFQGGRLRANLEATRARFHQAVAAYEARVLDAYHDVEDALSDAHAYEEELASLREAARNSAGYVRIGGVQYRRGLTNYLTVIDAERTLLSTQLSVAQTDNLRLAASVRLIKALGGGWTQNEPPIPKRRPVP